jgi:hypothetical protein
MNFEVFPINLAYSLAIEKRNLYLSIMNSVARHITSNKGLTHKLVTLTTTTRYGC